MQGRRRGAVVGGVPPDGLLGRDHYTSNSCGAVFGGGNNNEMGLRVREPASPAIPASPGRRVVHVPHGTDAYKPVGRGVPTELHNLTQLTENQKRRVRAGFAARQEAKRTEALSALHGPAGRAGAQPGLGRGPSYWPGHSAQQSNSIYANLSHLHGTDVAGAYGPRASPRTGHVYHASTWG